MPLHPLLSHQRQVHLDFHTSPHIGDVASEFDAREFARVLKRARVNSVTVFAKCHHGMSYYPTKIGTPHPALKGRDLMGEQIEALHREGIRAPLYTTVAFEEDVAHRFPEWRMMRRNGTFVHASEFEPGKPRQAGGWWYNNFLHPAYQDYIEAHIRELFAGYEVDGIFFDILFFPSDACWSEASSAFRAEHHLLADDRATQTRFEVAAQEFFCRRFTKLVRGLNPKATLYYNSTNPIFTDAKLGIRRRHDLQSHWELESLPSGFWVTTIFPGWPGRWEIGASPGSG